MGKSNLFRVLFLSTLLALSGCQIVGGVLTMTGDAISTAGHWMKKDGSKAAESLGKGAGELGAMIGGPIGSTLQVLGAILTAAGVTGGAVATMKKVKNAPEGRIFGPVRKPKEKGDPK